MRLLRGETEGRANEGADMVWDEWHKQGKVLETMWDDRKGRESDEEDVAAIEYGQKGVGQQMGDQKVWIKRYRAKSLERRAHNLLSAVTMKRVGQRECPKVAL